jgi:hypothetical protein
MVEKAEAILTWKWLGPLLLSMVVSLCAGWAWNTSTRLERIETYIISAEKRDASQQGQFDTIIFRLNKLSERIENMNNILLNHSNQNNPSFQFRSR